MLKVSTAIIIKVIVATFVIILVAFFRMCFLFLSFTVVLVVFSLATPVVSVEGPASSRTIFAASEAQLLWNATGTALLVYAQSDTDATSYYGSTGLFLMQAHPCGSGGECESIKVEQSKDGPVHDAKWSPLGDW
jgi:hypothetical protein